MYKLMLHTCRLTRLVYRCTYTLTVLSSVKHSMNILPIAICYSNQIKVYMMSFTYICELLVHVLSSLSTEQYDAFVKFSHDQVERRLAESAFSCEYNCVLLQCIVQPAYNFLSSDMHSSHMGSEIYAVHFLGANFCYCCGPADVRWTLSQKVQSHMLCITNQLSMYSFRQ